MPHWILKGVPHRSQAQVQDWIHWGMPRSLSEKMSSNYKVGEYTGHAIKTQARGNMICILTLTGEKNM